LCAHGMYRPWINPCAAAYSQWLRRLGRNSLGALGLPGWRRKREFVAVAL
jgi:hypothetical protein